MEKEERKGSNEKGKKERTGGGKEQRKKGSGIGSCGKGITDGKKAGNKQADREDRKQGRERNK